jgi:flagellar biosynthesis/type III secretory pathway protein FliH
MAASREDQAAAVVAAALELAAEIVGRAPPIDGDVLAERIRDALSAVDERELTLHLSREDHAALGEAMASRFDLAVAADAALAPGEARLTGAWARAELTREAAVGAIREAL